MKKILFLFLVGLCSCSQNQSLDEISDSEVKSVQVSIIPSENEIDSRLNVTSQLKYLWESNDTIGIFPNKGGQVEFPVTEESVGTTKANFNGGGWALKSGFNYSAYYPYNFYNRNAAKIPFSYEGQVLQGSENRVHLSKYALMIANPTAVENGALTFSMGHVGCILYLKLTLPEAKTYASLELYADSKIIPVKKIYNILETGAPEEVVAYNNHLSVGLNNITTTAANEVVGLWIAFPVMNVEGKTLKAVVKDSQGYVYVGDIIRTNDTTFSLELARNKAYAVKASPVLSDGFTGGIEDWQNDGQDYGGTAQ